jgi:PAS domain S-box-containing protein
VAPADPAWPSGRGGGSSIDADHVWGALAAAPLATALLSPGGELLRANRALCDLIGRTEAGLLALGLDGIVHPEDRERDAEELRRLLAGETAAYQLQQRCRRADGEAISVLASAWMPGGPERPPSTGPARPPVYVVRQLV